ncbi:unnamed protein product, partial [Mesorhabditis belari]|uniref:Uncharacterized protein n=1 Tax=Mesorhabditis belari TaxID=2138241 RepID=A0AAF3FRA3_9BILA
MYFTLAWFPAVQPIVLIFGVGSYRKKVLQLFVLFLHEARIVSKIRLSKLSSVSLKEDITSTHSSRITTSVHGH